MYTPLCGVLILLHTGCIIFVDKEGQVCGLRIKLNLYLFRAFNG